MATQKPKSDAFSLDQHAGTAVLRFRASVFEIARNLQAKEELLTSIAETGRDPEVKTLLLFGSPSGQSPEAYAEFLGSRPEGDIPEGETRATQLEVRYSREENALAQVVLAIHQLPRVTIACLRGRTAAPFFGASLAFDFRLVCDDAWFSCNDTLLGVPPGGAIGFFLPRYIGCGRAAELLLLGGPLSARQALELGLVNAVYPEADFEGQCLAWAERISRLPLSVVTGMKSLHRVFPEEELAQYLRMETETMRRAMLEHWKVTHPGAGPAEDSARR